MQTHEEIQAEAAKQVVASVMGRGVTRGELSAAFDRVRDSKHWKNPIDATVALTDYERAELEEAIVFFTGSVPTFSIVAGGKYRVRADGYFVAIGA